ncbi:MAG: SLBB domain-containing protein [Sphingobacteriales bacterium]|nr:SLBB domain-containing protein [Sphingobacteriales bacterium]
MQRLPRWRIFIYIVLIFFNVQPITAFGQPPVVEQIPREMLPTDLDPKKMSQEQLSALLNDKNTQNTGKDKNADLPKAIKVEKDSLIKDKSKENAYSPEKTFGANVFINSSVTDLSELSTPPLDYPIGVGDHIIVALWGAAEFQQSYIVARDGAIFPQGLGKINVQGLTFENMRSVVQGRFRKVVPGGTKISVSLGQPRSINVNVVGNVNKPGPVTVSAFSNAFNVIAVAGGVTDFGNLRNIQIKRGGKLIDTLDVYKYLTTGDFGNFLYLQNNDFVIVTFVEKKVQASGQFKRPMFYQLKKDEGIKALLNYAGGLSAGALGSIMRVLRTENEKQVQRDVNANAVTKISGDDFMLNDGDIVRVEMIKTGIVNKVELQGEVNYPGVYELRKGDRLFDVINRAGGVTRNTYLPRAYIFRGAGDSANLKSDRLEINLAEFESNFVTSSSNVELSPNDVIQLFAQSEFGDQQYVEIFGEVRKEGKVKKYGGMSLQDLLYLSGGLKPSAEYGRLEISSIVNMDSAQVGLKPTRTVIKSYAIQSNLQIDNEASKVMLKPYDQVFVRKNPTFELQQNVELRGLVLYPGLYSRLDKYERLSSYIERAGGVKENANLEGAVLLRVMQRDIREIPMDSSKIKLDSNGVIIKDSLPAELRYKDEPVSIDLAKALQNKNSKYDIILQENDVVYVPEVNPFISVEGRVQSPLKIAFDKEHTKTSYYINKAGGFGVRPWRKRVYVTYANGKSERTRNFLFIHSYPKVKEGCVVTVPERPQGQEMSDIAKSILLSTIPAILTAVILKNIN